MQSSWKTIYTEHKSEMLHRPKPWEPPITVISNPYDDGPISVEALPDQWTKEQIWEHRDRVDMFGRVRKRSHHK